MDNKNTIIIGLLALIAGLLIGYFASADRMPHHGGLFWEEAMYEEMGEHMYGDDIINSDGELRHMMDEMLLIGRGQTGKAYEEAWLRGMIVHHLGAVAMSEALLEQTERPELIELANTIIETQTAEVEQMRGWLNAWFN